MKSARVTAMGRRLIHLGPSWSMGVPAMYLGRTWAPRRIARYVMFDTREVSTAMSVAELPMPSTSAFLSMKRSSGSR
jgi:hypothetical protein